MMVISIQAIFKAMSLNVILQARSECRKKIVRDLNSLTFQILDFEKMSEKL